MLKLKNLKKASSSKKRKKKDEPAKPPQGITAKGNALRRIGGAILIIMLGTALAGFAFLALIRESTLQEQQVERVAYSFARQQATNVHRLLERLETRVKSAALSPLALSAIASRSEKDIDLVEKAFLDYFPEAVSLRVIPIGDMGTADFTGGNRGLRNHIEVDMVRRASEGEETEPEAYKFEEKWLTSLAAKVKHPRIDDHWAVIVVTLDNNWLSGEMNSVVGDSGRFALEQAYTTSGGKQAYNVIAASGSAASNAISRHQEVPDTAWRVTFSPSESLQDSLKISPVGLYSVLGAVVIATLVSVAMLLLLFPRKINAEVNRIISAADDKSTLTLSIPELVTIAKQLRRATLRALRKSNEGAWEIPSPEVTSIDSPEEAGLVTPLSETLASLDENAEIADLDLDIADEPLAKSPAGGGLVVPEHIFRAYDIRGNADTELTDELVANIGSAIGTIAGEQGEETLIIGCDGRNSSPRIKSALVRALMESGRNVIDIGLVPTPLLYFATRHLAARSGIMITGSHNPADQNGLKIVLDQQTIAAGGIQEIRQRIASGNYSMGNGQQARQDVIPSYMEAVLQDIAIAVPLKIVVDASNGATSQLAPTILEALGCEVVPLNCQIDGSFPGHPPDTSNEANLVDLADKVVDVRADFGVAFDGDGDRLAVVTPSGDIVRSDVLLMLYAQDVVSRNPGADVVFDVKCSRQLSRLITEHGGRPVLWKTGHAFMKEKMQETQALLGGEFSGHMFFGERWYGFDDGLYAACRLAEILSTHGESLDDCIARFPATINTPEIIIPVPDQYKFQLVDKIIKNADFSSGKINTMDGIRVDFSNGWGLVRASNTGPALTARFEADTRENLEIIQEEFKAQIALVDPEIELEF